VTLHLKKLMHDGFVGEAIAIEFDDIVDVLPMYFQGEFSNIKVEASIVVLKDGQRIRVQSTKAKIVAMCRAQEYRGAELSSKPLIRR
jgi:hypothetical protein